MFSDRKRIADQSGDSSRLLSREELLAQNAKLREGREKEESQSKAALIVQKWYRRVSGARKAMLAARGSMRKAFDDGWAAFVKARAGQSSSAGTGVESKEGSTPSEALLDLCRLCVSVYDRKQDSKRLLSVCAAIVKSVPAERSELAGRPSNFFSGILARDPARARAFCRIVRKLVVLCLEVLRADCEYGAVESPQAFGLIASCALTALDTRKWNLVAALTLTLAADGGDQAQRESEQIERLFWPDVFAPLVSVHRLYDRLAAVVRNLCVLENSATVLSSAPAAGGKGGHGVFLAAMLLMAQRGLAQPASLPMMSSTSIALAAPFVRMPCELLFASRLLTLPLLSRHLLGNAQLVKSLREFQNKQWVGLVRALHAAVFPHNGADGGASLPAWARASAQDKLAAAAAAAGNDGKESKSKDSAASTAAWCRAASSRLPPVACVLFNALHIGLTLDSHLAADALQLLFLELVGGLLELCPSVALSRQALRSMLEVASRSC